VTILLAVGLLIACWFIAHAEALRYVVVSSYPTSKCEEVVAKVFPAFHRRHVCSLQRLGYCKTAQNPSPLHLLNSMIVR
jgi:hypothetical protein